MEISTKNDLVLIRAIEENEKFPIFGQSGPNALVDLGNAIVFEQVIKIL